MASRRENILENVKTTLAAITTGGGYNWTVGEALRGLKHFNRTPEDKFPALYIAGADEKTKNVTNTHFRSDLFVSVVGYVKTANAADEQQLEKDLDKLITDVRKALMVDPSRAGFSTTTEINEIDTDKGAWVPYAGFEMLVRCEYRKEFSDP